MADKIAAVQMHGVIYRLLAIYDVMHCLLKLSKIDYFIDATKLIFIIITGFAKSYVFVSSTAAVRLSYTALHHTCHDQSRSLGYSCPFQYIVIFELDRVPSYQPSSVTPSVVTKIRSPHLRSPSSSIRRAAVDRPVIGQGDHDGSAPPVQRPTCLATDPYMMHRYSIPTFLYHASTRSTYRSISSFV